MFKDYLYYLGFRIYSKVSDISKAGVKSGYKTKVKHNKNQRCRRYSKRKTYIFQKCAVVIAAVLWFITACNMLWGISGYGFLNYVTAGSHNTVYNSNRIVDAFGGTFEDMSFKKVQGSVSVYAKYCDIAITDNAKDIILEQIAEKIGINRYTIEQTTEDGNNVKTLAQSSAAGDVICKFITVNKEENSLSQTGVSQYIYIGITLNDTIDAIFTYEEIVKDILKSLEIESQVTVNLKGTIDGKLDNERKDIITNTILDKTGATVVAEKKDDNMYTVYGYDKNIKDYIISVNHKININISMSYDEKKDETSVYYSTPLNNEDY